MWWRSVKELFSGKAFVPDEEDIDFPLNMRLRGKPLLVVQQKNQTVLCRVVKQNRSKEWVVIHAEDVVWDADSVRSCWMRLQINMKVEHAVWVDDGEWEAHESRMCWKESGHDLQNALAAGKIIPAEENEKGRIYAPVVAPSGEVFLFSIRRDRMEAAVSLLQECGYRVVRTGIVMAMTCRCLLPRILSSDVSPKYWIIVSEGSVLMLYQNSGRVKQVGQWCGNAGEDARMELYELWSGRMKDKLADVCWVMADAEYEPHEFPDRRNLHLHMSLVVGENPVIQWDPSGDIQPELRQGLPQVRPCLSWRWKMTWRLVLAAYVGLFAWWGYELWQGRLLTRERQVLLYEEEHIRHSLTDLRTESKELMDEQDGARRIGAWVRSLIYTQQLVPVLTSALPSGIKLRDLTLRLFEGQRQVEIVVEMNGTPQLLSQASPLLIRRLEESGFQMVSLDQSDSGEGIRFRGIFLHLPKL